MIGLAPADILGWPVEPIPTDQTILYIAADRPKQAMRSLRRMIPTTAKNLVRERLIFEHTRQLYADQPHNILEACQQANAKVVVIDSTKDVAVGPLKDEATAKSFMDNIQACIANDIEVIYMHHPRKAPNETGKREIDIDDVYGSTWLTAGAGSVLLVNGKPGSGLLRVEQLKAPSQFIQPFDVSVNYDTGELTKRTIRDLEDWLENYGMPVTRLQAAAFEQGLPEDDIDTDGGPYKNTVRRLERLATDGTVAKTGKNPIRYQWKGAITAQI